ncbi:hypothetical protein DPEC_G00245100 [Dallia pectoralis]|uniref:Uncharacterized protein n=1 Tax=Dallia pectoralis TaxID=75939 RepID=A0ACC2FVR5_DALPE|nr:hypothetical protein DPEC_G00245100 [Dallia pectoralis]
MLLPSDIARLVLGYLQQEGLCSTSQAFVFESPNLKEYAEHSSDDGTIPACVFSLFGKNLITILNEYVAVKAKETCEETHIPAMMTSLWKKLDFTLNQIKSMQNSPAVIQNQRLRTRNGIVNLRGRQRVLSTTQSSSPGCLPLSEPLSDQGSASQFHSPQIILGRPTQVCYTSPQTRPSPICPTQAQIQDGERLLISVNRETPLQIIVPENRLTQGPISPGRRKCDSPRRRGGGSGGSSGTGRANMAACHPTAEPQNEEVVTENFPQMVIQNARERILNDKSLQEKLAENINKILASDGSPQATKASCSTMEPDPSIDEILGLQGEIHMSNDAIQDILEQTESDPAFQALFDLFEYGKSKTTEDNEQGAGNLRNSTTESEVTEARCVDSCPETGDPGTGPEHSACRQETTTTRSAKTKSSQEPESKKTRKSAAPVSSTSKATPGTSTRGLRRGASTPCLSASNEKPVSAASSAGKDSEATFIPDDSGMDIDEPLNSAPLDTVSFNTVFDQRESTPTSTGLAGTSVQVSECNTSSSNSRTVPAENNRLENNNVPTASTAIVLDVQHSPVNSPSASVTSMPMLYRSNQGPSISSNLPRSDTTPPSSDGISQPPPQTLPAMAVPDSVTATSPSPTLIQHPTGKDMDPSKIVALKIIISDEAEEPSSDTALSQAVSSITGDRIPTIFLSSPAKSPAKAPTLNASSIAAEETVQAVNSLRGSEVIQTVETNLLRGKAGTVAAPTGTSSPWTQPGYYIQLPFDSATSTYGGATNSYFLVTDTTATGPNSNKVMSTSGAPQGRTVPTTSYALATPPRYSAGSRLIVSSPINLPVQSMLQNMVVPVSVVGQNNAAQFSVVSNQLLAVPSPASKVQPAAVKTNPKLAPKDKTVSCQIRALGLNETTKKLNPSCESTQNQNPALGSSPSHRRMLCFDGSAGDTFTQTSTASPSFKAPAATALVLPSVQQAEKECPKLVPAKSAVLESGRPKRRIETVRCMGNTQTTWTGTETEKSSAVRNHKKDVKKTPSKRDADRTSRRETSRSQSPGSRNTAVSQSESSNSSRVRRRSQSADRKDEGERESANVQSSRSSASEHRLRSGSRKEIENEDAERPDLIKDGPVEGCEGQDANKTCPQKNPHVTANRKNELEVGRQESRLSPGPTACSSKTPSKTSPLTKQAAEMLHDIQGLNPPSTPPKRSGKGCLELPVPRTPGSLQGASLDCHRTPARQRQGRDGEGTPRRLVPPVTPDLPSCSPASEAGSENSINMAAHTLMILSRAAIARTGTPLKDSLRQEGVGAVSPVASKGKKRKQPEALVSLTAKKDHPVSSGSKKKAKKQKKLLDSFPDDLDVEKFLSSLHYDE